MGEGRAVEDLDCASVHRAVLVCESSFAAQIRCMNSDTEIGKNGMDSRTSFETSERSGLKTPLPQRFRVLLDTRGYSRRGGGCKGAEDD